MTLSVPTLAKRKIGLTGEELAVCKRGWEGRLKSSLLQGAGGTNVEHALLALQACTVALHLLDNVVEPMDQQAKSAAIQTGATAPRFKDEGGTEDRPRTGPYAKPNAGAGPVRQNIPPPEMKV